MISADHEPDRHTFISCCRTASFVFKLSTAIETISIFDQQYADLWMLVVEKTFLVNPGQRLLVPK